MSSDSLQPQSSQLAASQFVQDFTKKIVRDCWQGYDEGNEQPQLGPEQEQAGTLKELEEEIKEEPATTTDPVTRFDDQADSIATVRVGSSQQEESKATSGDKGGPAAQEAAA